MEGSQAAAPVAEESPGSSHPAEPNPQTNVIGEGTRQFAGLGPCLSLVVGKDREGVQLAAGLSQQDGDTLPVRGQLRYGLAEVRHGMFGNNCRLEPS